MFKRITLFLCLALFVFAAGYPALADDAPTAGAVVNPTDFLAPGETTLSVTVNNRSSGALGDLRISTDPNAKGDSLGTLEAGKSGLYEFQLNIGKNTLEAGKVNVYISYRQNGKTHRLQTAAAVKKVNALPQAQLTCHFHKTEVYEGEPVRVEYTLRNTGTVAMLNARIEDSAFSFASEVFSLSPGEEKHVVCVHMLTKNLVSAPRAVYTSAESGTEYTLSAVGSSLFMASDDVSVSVTAQKDLLSYRERASFEIEITNNGPFSYTSCVVESPVFGTLTDFPSVLEPGESVKRIFETKHLTESASGVFTLTAREESGSVKSFSSQEITVNVSPGSDRMPVLTVVANNQGPSPFTITVTGAGQDLENVRLLEKKLGLVKEIAYLAANVDTVLQPKLDVFAGEDYVFSIEWTKNDETESVAAERVKAVIGTVHDDDPGITGYANATFYAIVHAAGLSSAILYGCVIIIVLILALTVILQLRKKRLAKRELRETLGRTNKFAPVRTRENEKE